MSYCRWSTDDYQCDVYVFEHVDGYWQTYVAGRKRRLREGVSFPPPLDNSADPDAWFARDHTVDQMIDEKNEGVLWDWEAVPQPPEGDSFQDATPGECADRLERLRGLGLSVPQDAIDTLRAEEAARATEDR